METIGSIFHTLVENQSVSGDFLLAHLVTFYIGVLWHGLVYAAKSIENMISNHLFMNIFSISDF